MLNDQDISDVIRKAHAYKLPEWRSSEFGRVRHNLRVHTKGIFFKKIEGLYPNEHPDSRKHCVESFEPITKGSIWKAINNLQRIFTNSAFSITASDRIIEKANSNLFDKQNFFNWFVKNWIERIIADDPNTFIAVYPDEYTKLHGGGIVRFIESEHVRHVDKDMAVFISVPESQVSRTVVSEHKTETVFYDSSIGGPNIRLGVEKTFNPTVETKFEKEVYHIVTKEYILRFWKEGSSFDYDLLNFKNPLSILPFFQASSPELHDGVQESHVQAFIPFGNLALIQHRSHRAVDLMFSYPRMSEIQTPCDNVNCQTDNAKPEKCQKCGGSGYITVQSPYKVYQKKVDTGLSDPELVKQVLAAAPVDFHTPNTSILDYSKNSWRDYLAMAEEAVYIQQKQTTGNVESADAKRIDREAEYAWVSGVSKSLHGDMRSVLQLMEAFDGGDPNAVSIDEPTSFALVTEAEAFEALTIIIGSDAPVMVKAQQVDKFVHKYINKSSPLIKMLDVLKLIDPLLYYSNKEVQVFKINQTVTPEAWATHVYAYPIIMQMYQSEKTIFEKPIGEIVNQVKEALKAYMPTPVSLKDRLALEIG